MAKQVLLFMMVVGLGLTAGAASFRDQVEADWLLQEQYRYGVGTITTADDAAGAVDGVKDGGYGFHTNKQNHPWWQVDLKQVYPVDRVVIWNRCDAVGVRNNKIRVRVSVSGRHWENLYQHDGTNFGGGKDNAPLVVPLKGVDARFVRLDIPGKEYFHLDEVEVFGTADPDINLALHKPALQCSTSQWSAFHELADKDIDYAAAVARVISHSTSLIQDRQAAGESMAHALTKLDQLKTATPGKKTFLKARWLHRDLLLNHPIIDFDQLLFAERVPGSFSHMSDQYYGWWSRPGGGLYLLDDLANPEGPQKVLLSDLFTEEGSFLRPTLSYDGKRVLFAWCKHYPKLAAEKDKLNKANVPEDAFYHLFELSLESGAVRKLSQGKYDDFDGRYLPDGSIVFLSTRRGRGVQLGKESGALTMVNDALPDCYVRCGGGPERPVAVYTLHRMDANGDNLVALSPFEMFEWTPDIAHDGRILYSRWDYVDRDNMPFMGLWSINPDGTNAQLVYGNYTHRPHCTFEPRSIPNSNKIVFTGSAHHAQTMGSLVMLDPAAGLEGDAPMTLLTPEVVFPEIDGWPKAFFANPWPLSERFYLVAWGVSKTVKQGTLLEENVMGLYLLDAEGGMELIYRNPDIASQWPIPVTARPVPMQRPETTDFDPALEGKFLVQDVYEGLRGVPRGTVKALRIVAVPAKTHPTMNFPSIGLTDDDPGKCVLGTVPVEADGSAFFNAPSGVMLFFQALDARGMAVQTMRSSTHVQPGQTLSCIGCHETRTKAPPTQTPLAAKREPSKIIVGPEGSWPLRFDTLVQPVLDKHCVGCHDNKGDEKAPKGLVLTGAKSYEGLSNYGSPSLKDHIVRRYQESASKENACAAESSVLLEKLTGPKGHHGVKLSAEDLERLIIWMDTYAQRLGSFDEQQEHELVELRNHWKAILSEG